MNRYLLITVVLLASVCSFATQTHVTRSNQFRAKRSHTPIQLKSRPAVRSGNHKTQLPLVPPTRAQMQSQSSYHRTSQGVQRHGSSAPTTTVGVVSATQFALGGEDDDNTQPVLGDFNGDGRQDSAKVVRDISGNYWISVLLSNGDGTFEAAQLTATPGNADDPIIVGDLDGDGSDDLIMVHPGNGCCCDEKNKAVKQNVQKRLGCEVSSTFDVLLSNSDGTFTAGNNYAVSDFNLAGGLLTDTNGDGKLDVLAIDGENPAAVVVLLGVGDGTFQAVTTQAMLSGPAPYDIQFADFNGDGKLDFAGLNDGQLAVYLASDSGYATPVSLVTSDANYNICEYTTGDLTGDGKPEVASSNCDNTVTVYANNGDGSFQTGVYSTNAGNEYVYPEGAAIADFNGDGKNDLAVTGDYGGTISIFLGNGDGTLTPPTVGYGVGGYTWETPLVADFNGDGLMDILEPDDEFSMVYLQGYGDGTFRATTSYYLPQSHAEYAYSYSTAVGDFNGDGFSDVVSGQDGNTAAPGVVVYLANSDGSLKPGVNYGTSSTLAYVTVADFNGDGKLDIAATDYANGNVQIFLGVGDGTFTVGNAYATDSGGGPYPGNVVTGDFNQDGNLDLAVVNEETATVGVLFGAGDGTFGQLTNLPISASAYGITAADLNGDGFPDLAVALNTEAGSTVAVFLAKNDNSGTFQPEADVVTGTGRPEYIAFGDLDGDGKLDMAVSMNYGPSLFSALVVALGNGDGTFKTANAYASSIVGTAFGGGGYVTSVLMTDYDGDGKQDLVYVNSDYGTLGILYGKGDGTFYSPVEFPSGEYTWGLAMGDINGDGAMDLVTSNYYVGGTTVMLNNSGTGTQPNFTAGSDTSTQTVTAGASATFNLTVTGKNGYNGTITFACTGLPTGAACTFSPASVVSVGNVAGATTLTISSTAAGTASLIPVWPNTIPVGPGLLACITGLGMFGLVLAGAGRKRSRWQMSLALGVMLLVMMFTMLGCSSSSTKASTATPAGSYPIVVTSTGTGTGAPTHTMTLTFVVQ